MKEQVMIYEVKQSAATNADDLFSKDGQYFYWNSDKFKNLDNGDFVFVVNRTNNWVLLTKLDETSIQTSIKGDRTYFTDRETEFDVEGSWKDFIRLQILKKENIPVGWNWKSLGSSETTYLNGNRVNTNSASNRVTNINQLKEISSNHLFNEVLESCLENFRNDSARFYPELMKFIEQSDTSNLKTKDYEKNFLNLKVKVSFGQGYPAKIPWISFLGPGQTTSKGIYPVYLLYKEHQCLILAHGISETHTPDKQWNLKNAQSISDHFNIESLGKPDRYGDSYVFRSYDLKNLPDENKLDSDLNSIIEQYMTLFDNSQTKSSAVKQEKLDIPKLKRHLVEAGLLYNELLITRFVASLLTKPFVILTGLSGSGKTKLAQAFVQWICQDPGQYKIVPVGADWTNREPLLGYPNALQPEEYIKPENGVLDLILKAKENPSLPYFLILDEMNLSHVERYFADFLSAMESDEPIPLFNEGSVQNTVPAKVTLPKNFFTIGTVNIDETTNMFSPKVLDRANTIEFRVTDEEIKTFLEQRNELNMNALNSKGAAMSSSFLDYLNNKSFPTEESKAIIDSLLRFFGELKKSGAEFGFRSASEIMKLIHQLSVLDDTLNTNEKLDVAIIQKLLPKLHGSRRKLVPTLITLGSFCIKGDIDIEKEVFEKEEFDLKKSDTMYPLSLEKIMRMYRGAVDNGYASFAEA